MPRNIEGSIYRTPDGKRWFVRLQFYDNDGNRREKKRICLTHKAASAKIAELREEIERDRSDRKTFRQLDKYFRDHYVHKAKFVGGKKLSGYRQNIKAVEYYLDGALNHFKDKYIDEITFADLKEYKRKIENLPTIHGRQRSVSDTNQFLKKLRRLFTIAVEQGWIEINPFNRGGNLITETFETERTRVITRDEEKLLLEKCTGRRKHLSPIIIFAVETGMRRGEIQSLRWSSIDLGRRIVRVESHNSKTLRSRLVPISARCAEVLAELWRNSNHRQDALVFHGIDFKKSFNATREKAGLTDVNFHDLRHTAITRMLEAGISAPLVMKISGHTQQKTFLRYVNQTENSIFEIAMQLDKAA